MTEAYHEKVFRRRKKYQLFDVFWHFEAFSVFRCLDEEEKMLKNVL